MATGHRILAAGFADTESAKIREAVFDLTGDFCTVDDSINCLAHMQRFQPHLVILDTAIVDVAAYELCSRIKYDHTVMVVIATTPSNLGDIDRAITAGNDDFLFKPIVQAECRRRVENLLQLYDALH